MAKPKLSKRSTQYFDIQLQDLMNAIGEDDLKDFPLQDILDSWDDDPIPLDLSRKVQKAYKLRRLKLIEL